MRLIQWRYKNIYSLVQSSTNLYLLSHEESVRSQVNKNFQRRWFVLKGNLLFYFEKKGDREPIGVIILEGCTIGEWLE